MSLARYALVAFVALGGSLGLLWAALPAQDPRARWGVALGGALAAMNSVAAYALVVWSSGCSTPFFFKAILGGMLARMIVLLGAVIVANRILGLPRLPLILSLLGYFILYLAFELMVVHRRATARPEVR